MPLFVRPAVLPDERKRLTDLLSRNLPYLNHDLRFDWMYRSNPAGRGRAWFICADDEDRVVGAASVFPKLAWVNRKLELCCQVGDFAVDVAYRSLGPALMLQRATLLPVERGEFAFCYDCPPHDRGMATFIRMGLVPKCQMARFARPLRAPSAVGKRLPGGSVLRPPLAAAIDGALRALRFFDRPPRDVEVQVHEDSFGEEFSSFDDKIVAAEADTVRARRHAEDLNWKYRLDPSHSYRALTARRSGSLEGYAIYRCVGERARLVDVASASDDVYAALLFAAAATAAYAGVSTIDLLAVSPSSEATLARRARFFSRGDGPRVVVYEEIAKSSFVEGMKWKLSAADITV